MLTISSNGRLAQDTMVMTSMSTRFTILRNFMMRVGRSFLEFVLRY